MVGRFLGSGFAVACVVVLSASACTAPMSQAPGVRAQEAAAPRVCPPNPQGQGAIHLGLRALDDDMFYEPVEEPFVLGFDYARRFQPGSPLGFEIGIFLAGDNEEENVLGSDVDLTTFFVEGDLGLRLSHDINRCQVFVGGGVAAILADVEIDVDGSNVLSEDDFTVGPYVHAGAIVYVSSNFFLGIDARLVTGTEIDFPSFVETDADYFQVALLLGWGA